MLKSGGTFFQYVPLPTNNTCPDVVNDTCDISVADYFPDIFMEWKRQCDGNSNCTLNVSPVSMMSHCEATCNSSDCTATHVTHQFECMGKLDLFFLNIVLPLLHHT